MITKNEIKYFSSLRQKKQREEERKIIVEGNKLITEGIESGLRPEVIITTIPFYESEPDFFESLKEFRIEKLKTPEFVKLTETKNPQEVAAVFSIQFKEFSSKGIQSRISVYLDQISDPGNVGTIIRTCDWFGITELLLSEDSVELYNPKVVRSSMGSVFHMNIYEHTKIEHLEALKDKGYKIICSDIEGQDAYSFTLQEKSILVFSNEAHGPDDKLLRLADHIISIKKKGKAESLNVASASAVILCLLTK
jgi:TrmH family RNA methyltransferase